MESLYGVKLGSHAQKVIEALGLPVHESKERLGDLSDVRVREYFPERSNPAFNVRFHVQSDRVIAASILFTE